MELGVRAAEIDSAAQRVRLDDGRILNYDGLMLSTGSRVRRLDVPGVPNLREFIIFGRLSDADKIRAELRFGQEVGHGQAPVISVLRSPRSQLRSVSRLRYSKRRRGLWRA